MRQTIIPPAPTGRLQLGLGAGIDRVAQKAAQGSAMDAAFLGRIYLSMLWFGTVATLLSAAVLNKAGVASFAGGLVLAALLLRTQEVLVRAVLRPKAEIGGIDPRMVLLIALPFKYGAVIVALFIVNHFGLLMPGSLALGFFAGQIVIFGKVFGWAAKRRSAH